MGKRTCSPLLEKPFGGSCPGSRGSWESSAENSPPPGALGDSRNWISAKFWEMWEPRAHGPSSPLCAHLLEEASSPSQGAQQSCRGPRGCPIAFPLGVSAPRRLLETSEGGRFAFPLGGTECCLPEGECLGPCEMVWFLGLAGIQRPLCFPRVHVQVILHLQAPGGSGCAGLQAWTGQSWKDAGHTSLSEQPWRGGEWCLFRFC